jgi:hypothetical protein
MGIYSDVKGLLVKSFKFPYSDNAKTEVHQNITQIKYPILFVPEYQRFDLKSKDVLSPIYFNSDETIMCYLQDEKKIAVYYEQFDHINIIMKEIKNIHRCRFADHFELNHFYFNIHIWREYNVLITRIRTNSFNFIYFLLNENEKLEKYYLIQEILKNEYSKGILSN